jgi:putative DNA primase/helicase
LRKLKPSPPGMFHILCRDAYNLQKRSMPDLADDDGRDEIDRVIKGCNPDLIVLDSLSTLVRRGVENDAESWQPIQDWLLKHRWQGRTVLLVHHAGKAGQQRGTSKREDTLDTVIGLRKRIGGEEEDSGDSVFELEFTKARDFHGRDAEPLLLRLRMQDGMMVWSHEPIRSERDRRIQVMLKEGLKQKDIAKELDLSAARVNQIVKKLKREDNVIKGPWQERNKQDDQDQHPDA